MATTSLSAAEMRALSEAMQGYAASQREDIIGVLMKQGSFHYLSEAEIVALAKKLESGSKPPASDPVGCEMASSEENRYQEMVGNRWLTLYCVIAGSLTLTGWVSPSFVRAHANVFLALIFFGPTVLPYLFIPPRRFWRPSR